MYQPFARSTRTTMAAMTSRAATSEPMAIIASSPPRLRPSCVVGPRVGRGTRRGGSERGSEVAVGATSARVSGVGVEVVA